MPDDPVSRFWSAAERYRSADSLQASARFVVETEHQGLSQRETSRIETVWQRPGRLQVLSGDDGRQSGVLSDGKTIQFRLDHLRLLIEAPAPADEAGLALCPFYLDALNSLLEFGPPPASVLAFCLGLHESLELVVSPGFDRNHPWFGEFSPGPQTVAVMVRLGGMTAVYWIDDDRQVTQLAIEGTDLAALEAMELIAPHLGRLAVRDGMEQFVTRYAVVYERQVLDEPIPAESFAARAPDDATVVRLRQLDWGELVTVALYGPPKRAQESPAPGRGTGR